MSTRNIMYGFVFTLFFVGCEGSSKDDITRLSELAMQGKDIFAGKDCGKCHSVGEMTAAYDTTKLIDLSNPIIANDSLFVRTHLVFVQESKMPPIDLSQKEIRLLGHYIAELHAATHRTVADKKANRNCPVCYAPVSREDAIKQKLFVSYLNKTYYFECCQCKETFQKAPEAFLLFWQEAEQAKSSQKAN